MRDVNIRFQQNGASIGYRHFFRTNTSMELFLYFFENGTRFIALKENYLDAFTNYTDNVRVYYGYGVHTGVSYANKYKIGYRVYRHSRRISPLFGFNGICGIEYQMPDIPVSVSADIKPYFEYSLVQIFKLDVFDAAISVRYRL